MHWTTTKPKKSGAYWVRGFDSSKPTKKALVEVQRFQGRVVCNLHCENSDPMDDGPDDWFDMRDLAADFQWCGPLLEPTNDH